eukprot:gene18602-25116_t
MTVLETADIKREDYSTSTAKEMRQRPLSPPLSPPRQVAGCCRDVAMHMAKPNAYRYRLL